MKRKNTFFFCTFAGVWGVHSERETEMYILYDFTWMQLLASRCIMSGRHGEETVKEDAICVLTSVIRSCSCIPLLQGIPFLRLGSLKGYNVVYLFCLLEPIVRAVESSAGPVRDLGRTRRFRVPILYSRRSAGRRHFEVSVSSIYQGTSLLRRPRIAVLVRNGFGFVSIGIRDLACPHGKPTPQKAYTMQVLLCLLAIRVSYAVLDIRITFTCTWAPIIRRYSQHDYR